MSDTRGTHNYIIKLANLIEAGVLPIKTGLTMVDVLHDDDCSCWSGGLCDCDPDITLKQKLPMFSNN